MNNMQIFPDNVIDFINEYKFKDDKEIYTNGSDLISVFRVKQAWDYYTRKNNKKNIELLLSYIHDYISEIDNKTELL